MSPLRDCFQILSMLVNFTPLGSTCYCPSSISSLSVASKPGGAGGALAPPLFCHAVSNENNMKNIEITNGFIFKKTCCIHYFQVANDFVSLTSVRYNNFGTLLNPTYNFTSDRLFVPFFRNCKFIKV